MMQRGDVHHNYFHEIKRNERGYGVYVRGLTTPLITRIEADLFNDNRHAIAGGGFMNDRYEAFHNTVVFNNSNGHTFDMHGQNGRAGDYFKIQYNTLQRIPTRRRSRSTSGASRSAPPSSITTGSTTARPRSSASTSTTRPTSPWA